MISTIEDVITGTLKVISATAKVILATEKVITGTLKAISATTKGDIGHKKLILATEEVITAILKVISATTKAIDSPASVVIRSLFKICIEHYHWDWWRLDLNDNLFYVFFLFQYFLYNKTRIV